MQFYLVNILLLVLFVYLRQSNTESSEGQCGVESSRHCQEESGAQAPEAAKYAKASNEIYTQIQHALQNYTPCAKNPGDPNCECYADVITQDLSPYQAEGISKQMIEYSEKYGTHYQVLDHRLYRHPNCMFPARCTGVEHFIIKLLPQLPDMEFIINTRDWPQVRAFPAPHKHKAAVLSFSKTQDYLDIMFPAWTFWAGGPAISLHPTGIGRWDLLRQSITKTAEKTPWDKKRAQGFFRGSRTSDERDALVLLSRRMPDLVDAQYTKNQAWKSPKDTLNAEPAAEVSFADHCQYKFLFNFRGVAASFRLKHLFLCKSLVFHVGQEWNEFFYFSLKPWVHYIPLKSYPSEQELEEILLFFREHDDLAEKIAQQGYEFIWQHLRLEDVECYWLKLLLEYQNLLTYKVEMNEELVEVTGRTK